MNWYKEYQDEWKEIIETVARELGRSEQMVEKDTIQSMFLFELAKSELPFVFKGGTSLSKAYNLIDRFSEDIDLSMNRRPTQSERVKSKELIIEIAENLGLVLSNPEEIKSRYDYNKYVFKYDSLFSVIPLEIIIETSYYQSVYPVDKHIVGSFVGRFCLDRNIMLPVPFEAAELMMNVQSVERTFVDKVFAVCDYKIQNMQDRDSRHLYDICKLLREVELNEGLDKLIDMVRDDRMQSKNNPSAQLEYFIPDMLKEIIRSRFYESDYKNVTQKLLYEDISYDYAIENGLFGKYTIETVLPMFVLIMMFFGIIGIVGPIVILGLLLLEVIAMLVTRTRSALHDLIADCCVVDLSTQMVFASEQALVEYKKKLHEEQVANSPY